MGAKLVVHAVVLVFAGLSLRATLLVLSHGVPHAANSAWMGHLALVDFEIVRGQLGLLDRVASLLLVRTQVELVLGNSGVPLDEVDDPGQENGSSFVDLG